MGIDVQPTIEIALPRSQVATFMFDPENDAKWTSGVLECRPLTPGRLRKGSKVERLTRFAGKTFSYVYEVVDADEDRMVEIKVDNPFPMQITYLLEDSPSGTKVSIRARGEPKGFFKIAAPLMSAMVAKNIVQDLQNLKRSLEGS